MKYPKERLANDVLAEMQHRHRLMIHDIKNVYALLNNNRTLSNRRTPEEALRESERVIDLACAKLKEMFDA